MDSNSAIATVLLDFESETQTIIISSQQKCDPRNDDANSSDGLRETLHPPLSRQPSPTSNIPTHASETLSKMSMPRSLVYASFESIDCKVFKHGVSSPITNAETLCRQQFVAMSSGSARRTLSFVDCCNSTVISIYDNLLSLRSH